MARETILVNLQRCTGCWSCSIGCKMVNELADDDYRLTVKTLGSGQGIDHPQGTWPNLSMSWQPVWLRSCTSCAEGQTEHGPFCVYTCPSRALAYGEEAREEADRLAAEGFELFEIPAWEGTRPNVLYAYKGASRPVPGEWPSHPIVEAEFVEDDGDEPLTVDGTLIGELFDNEAAAAVLAEHIPWLDVSSPEGAMAKGMTLVGMAPYSQGLLDEDTLAAIAADFKALAEAPGAAGETSDDGAAAASGAMRPAGGYTLKTKIRDLEKDPEAFAILAEYMPGFEIGSKEAKQAATLSIQMMAKFSGDLLNKEALADIEKRLAALGGDGAAAAKGQPKKRGFFSRIFGR